VAAEYSYTDERNSVADFLHLWPNAGLISILSRTYSTHKEDLLSIFSAFEAKVWISLLISYLLVYLINSIKTRGKLNKIFLAIDYISLSYGKSKKTQIKTI